MLDPAISKQIIETWEWAQKEPNFGPDKELFPSLQNVKSLLDVAFQASLEREEGAEVRFSLVLASKEDAKNYLKTVHKPSDETVMEFKNPMPCTADTIKKVASALNPTCISMAVWIQEDSEELVIWGTFMYAEPRTDFEAGSISAPGGSAFKPDLFTLSHIDSGSITVSRGYFRVGKFEGGTFQPAEPTFFTEYSLGPYFFQMIQKHDLCDQGNNYWRWYKRCVEYVISKVSRIGHGATIAIIDENESNSFSPRYQLKSTIPVNELIRKAIEINVAHSENIKNPTQVDLHSIVVEQNRILRERLDVVSRLATVDGALILSSELDVVAFSAVLNEEEYDGELLTGPDGWGKGADQNVDFTQFGTRHKSAIAFANANANAVVFVISQDGPVRGVSKCGESQLKYWRNCGPSASMFFW